MREREQRFDALYRCHAARVLGYLLRRTDRESARDVAAEVFTVAWRRLDQIPEQAGPWLLGVARRQLANHHRGQRRRRALALRLAQQPQRATPLHAGSDEFAVAGALHRLDEEDRELLLLIGWEELTPVEAAEALGISAEAARSRLHRARRRLQAALHTQEERG